MADFEIAFQRLVADERFVLSNHKTDKGGLTFCGITRKNYPGWPGWAVIDRGETPSLDSVRQFYKAEYWDRLHLGEVENQGVAGSLLSFHVVTSSKAASLLAQAVVGATPDGVIGPKTIAAINAMDPKLFIALYALAKVARYRDIVMRDRSQGANLLGWINRTLRDLQ